MNLLKKILTHFKAIAFLAVLCLAANMAYGGQISATGSKLVDLIGQQRGDSIQVNPLLCEIAQNSARQFFIDEFAQYKEFETDRLDSLVSVDGELMAMVLFSNYLSSGDAAGILFESIKEQSTIKEQSMDFEAGSGIFSSLATQMGVHVLDETISVGSARFNVYLAVVNYAGRLGVEGRVSEETLLMGARLYNMINQLRIQPDEVFFANGIVFDGSISEQALPSLSFVDIEGSGVVLSYFHEYSDDDDPVNVVNKIFYGLLGQDMFNEDAGGLSLLNPLFNGIDIQITMKMVEDNDMYKFGYDVVIGLGKVDLSENTIQGLFYSDDNLNDLYDPGEEIAENPMVIYDAGIHSRTGMAGGFCEFVEDSQKGYQIVLFPLDHDIVINDINASDKFVIIKL